MLVVCGPSASLNFGKEIYHKESSILLPVLIVRLQSTTNLLTSYRQALSNWFISFDSCFGVKLHYSASTMVESVGTIEEWMFLLTLPAIIRYFPPRLLYSSSAVNDTPSLVCTVPVKPDVLVSGHV